MLSLNFKRGVSPIISSILMVMIVVASMAIVITATHTITLRMRERMLERLTIEDVYFFKKGEKKFIGIYALNTGKVPLNIVAVYVDGELVITSPHSLYLEPLDSGWINATYPWKPEKVIHLLVVTERGNSVEDYYKAP